MQLPASRGSVTASSSLDGQMRQGASLQILECWTGSCMARCSVVGRERGPSTGSRGALRQAEGRLGGGNVPKVRSAWVLESLEQGSEWGSEVGGGLRR